jgi:hypothetical protein
MQLFLEQKERKFRNVISTMQCGGLLQLKTRRTNYLICWSNEICSTSDGNYFPSCSNLTNDNRYNSVICLPRDCNKLALMHL